MRTVGLTFGDGDSAKPISKMNKAELLEVAEAEGVDVDSDATKAQILAAIEEFRAGDGDSA